jgi:hypothetical protein
MLVANNTLVGLDDWAFAIGYDSARFSGAVDGLRVVNNILDIGSTRAFGITSALPSSVQIDYNLIRTSGQLVLLPDGRNTHSLATLTSWTGFQAHGLTGDPGFADAAGGDYHLTAGSPGIDAGVRVAGVTDSWAGSAPDIGRFERP